ncbi:MAG: DUF305 domain-containing protein [Anaerolineales bacterium]|nr:DUF305 domain-containing protein [Anaerolineales bacterium]
MTNSTQNTEGFSQENNEIEKASIPWHHPYVLFFTVLLLLLSGSFGYWLNAQQQPPRYQPPAADSNDVGFARDMSVHHRQAVEMASLLYDRTDDEILKILAYDILTTQQAQIGIMSGWLDIWGHRWSSSGPRMEWMGMSVTHLMPGMATQEELNQLRNAGGLEAEIVFLQLMIPHHESGVMMAEAAAFRAQTEVVRNLASGMAVAQQSEIEYMERLLQERENN